MRSKLFYSIVAVCFFTLVSCTKVIVVEPPYGMGPGKPHCMMKKCQGCMAATNETLDMIRAAKGTNDVNKMRPALDKAEQVLQERLQRKPCMCPLMMGMHGDKGETPGECKMDKKVQ